MLAYAFNKLLYLYKSGTRHDCQQDCQKIETVGIVL